MKNSKSIMAALDNLAADRNSKCLVPVLIIKTNDDGTVSFRGKIFSQKQFDNWAAARGFPVVIYDDLGIDD